MIWGVTGLLGGGKSYGSVLDMCLHIKRGGVVATNIELNLDKVARFTVRSRSFCADRYYHIDPDVDVDFWGWPRGDQRGVGNRRVLVVIDEAGEWFSGLLSRSKTVEFASWLRQSDKRGQDVYLIVQDASILAKQGRVLVHRWLYMRYMLHWRIPVLGWPLPPPWRYEFHRLEFDRTGRIPIGKTISMRDKRIFGIYQTSAMFGQSALQSSGVNPYEGLSEDDESPPISYLPYYYISCFWGVLWVIARFG